MRVCLFEDRGVSNLEPLTLTRPAFDLLCGQTSLAAKQCRHFAPCEIGALIRPHLADLYRLQQPAIAINDLPWLRAEAAILVNGRWLPPPNPNRDFAIPCVGMVGEEVAYAVVGPNLLTYCSSNTLEDCLETWKNTLTQHQAGGQMISYPWDLVQCNADELAADFSYLGRRRSSESSAAVVAGPADFLSVDPTAQVDPMVVADTRNGPVVIDQEAVVTAFTRLEGPCYIGPRTQVLGARIRGGTTVGPNCRIGGEVEASIIQGYSNKYHDGFLGHSYIGEWVNFGAGTQVSDLRNDYADIVVTVAGEPVPTGLTKVGCFVGDHTKTGLGTLLNTGTSVGLFCNLLPAGRLLPTYLPSFSSWWNGALGDHGDLPRLLPTASEVMRRRGVAMTEIHAALYRCLCDQTAAERRRMLGETSQRPLRRSA
jgi:UDP-N-acetylglucosamine diphosphorylase / glucose-1-phosphate thymidylyltransferase / UDP-N-acetylgalactosamine diphosphorylase / glucosamine-1-phosphate N-acetyltransferase / galactosamine-1-phosphate N-acetyltransferase